MTPEQTVLERIEAAKKHDASTLASLYVRDAVLRDPSYPQPVVGKESIRKVWEHMFKAFPDYEEKILTIAAKGNIVAIEAVMICTFGGVFERLSGPDLPPTNKHVELPFATFYKVNSEGLITEGRLYYDRPSLWQQMGIRL